MSSDTRVYAALVIARHGNFSRSFLHEAKKGLREAKEKEWEEHYHKCYEIANAFFYNDFYNRCLAATYLGSCKEKTQRLGHDIEIKVDALFLSQSDPSTEAIHLHVSFPDTRIDINNPDDPLISSMIGVLDSLYRFNEINGPLICPNILHILRSSLPQGSDVRDYALDVSRYLYISIAGNPKGVLENPSEQNLINMYRFLYIHDQGVNVEVARDHLRDPWSSTSFFRLYCQPGAVLSISTPFPADAYSKNTNWFFPENGLPAKWPIDELIYDYLPEYPPLRYLAIPALHFAAVHEETMRFSYNALLSNFDNIVKLWGIDKLGESIRSSFLSQNMEAVRLPIARSLVTKIIKTQEQTSTTDTVERVITRTLTSLQVTISLSAAAVALIALCIALWKALS